MKRTGRRIVTKDCVSSIITIMSISRTLNLPECAGGSQKSMGRRVDCAAGVAGAGELVKNFSTSLESLASLKNREKKLRRF